jgi:hypothetical protein
LDQTEPISTLKSVMCWKYCFEKITQFSHRYNVLDAEDSGNSE